MAAISMNMSGFSTGRYGKLTQRLVSTVLLIGLFMLAQATALAATDGVIDDFEGYGGQDAALQAAYVRNNDGNVIRVYLDREHAHDGAYSMRYEYTIGDPEWCGVIKSLPDVSWEGAKGIEFWLVPDGSQHSMTIQFRMATGEYWEAFVPISGRTEPFLVRLPFSVFVRPSWDKGGSNVIDLSAISSFAIYIGKAGGKGGTGTLYIDSIKLMR